MKRFLAILLCAALLAAPFIAFAADEEDELEELEEVDDNYVPLVNIFFGDHVPNEIIVKFFDRSEFPGKEKQYEDELNKLLGSGFDIISENLYLVKVDDLSNNANGVFNRFRNSKFVEYTELNYIGDFDLAPTDSLYARGGASYAKAINAEAGWDYATTSSVPIAIIDTGCSGNNDVKAAQYCVINNNLTDVYGHGTKVTGIIGAAGKAGKGNIGVIWGSENLISIKITETSSVTLANVVSGLDEAVKRGAKVINLSLSFASDSASLKAAVDRAYNAGCVIVAATGNDGNANANFPAAYPNVLGVGGTAGGTSRYASSNYGAQLDVLACWSWYTTTNAGTIGASSGTSMATPQVSGLAALAWELNPSLTNAQLMDLIRANTNRADGIWNDQTGYGTIDMGKTLAAAKAGSTPAAKKSDPPEITLFGDRVIELQDGEAFVEPGYAAMSGDGDITNTVKVSITSEEYFVDKVDPAIPGVYRLEYTVEDDIGSASAIRVVEVAEAIPVIEVPEVVPDTTPPVLTLLGSAQMTIDEDSYYEEPGYTAIDDVDGDISHNIYYNGTVNTARAGTYTITYSVTDKAGNTATATRTVEVVQVFVPVTEPPTEAPTEYEPEPPYEPEYIEDMDMDAPESEYINYETATQKESASAPDVSLVGSNPIILHIGGSAYVEQGIVATDEADGDISSSAVISGSVDTAAAGTYTITYTVTNSAGLASTISRTVRVLAPNETFTNIPYNFSGQTKDNKAAIAKQTLEVGDDGYVNVTKLSGTITLQITGGGLALAIDKTGKYEISAGTYDMAIVTGTFNGNMKWEASFTVPGETYVSFDDEEVPLGEAIFGDEPLQSPKTDDGYVWLAAILLVLALDIALAAKRKKGL